MEYKDLVAVYEKLDQTSKRLEKTAIISGLLKKTPLEDIAKITLLLQGKIFPNWDESKVGVAEKMVLKALSIASGSSIDQIMNEWKNTGDLGEVAKKLISKKKQVTLFEESLTVEKVWKNLRKIATIEGASSVDMKIKLIAELLTSAKDLEAKFITRTVLEELRLGVGDGTLRDALFWAFGIEKLEIVYNEEKHELLYNNEPLSDEKRKEYNSAVNEIQEGYNLTNDFGIVAELIKKEGTEALGNLSLEIGRPIKVMLYPKAGSMDDAFEKITPPLAIEYKYDGFRMQIHKKKNDILIFTRNLENVTKQFPDIVKAVQDHIRVEECIIDGEAVGFDPESKKYLPFQKISQRIKRKYDIKEIAKKFPVELNIFDIMQCDGKTLINAPLKERRAILEEKIEKKQYLITIAEQLVTDDKKKAEAFYQEALTAGNEGVMVKSIDAVYKPGARVGLGYKIKPVMESLDVVIVGAEWGHGKRKGWLTSFEMACINEEGEFVTLGNVGTGVKEKQTEEGDITFAFLTEQLKPLVKDEKENVAQIQPQIVIEVNFEEIQKSPTTTSGFALRFPRFIRLREDRSPESCSTLEFVEEMYYNQ